MFGFLNHVFHKIIVDDGILFLRVGCLPHNIVRTMYLGITVYALHILYQTLLLATSFSQVDPVRKAFV